MRPFLVITAVLFAIGASAGDLNLKKGVALDGYDPVAYFKDGPAEGKPSLKVEHEGATYYFSSQANREAFAANPKTYVPAYGGWCAWAMVDGEKVKIDPEAYRVVDGRLLLFYRGLFGNTLKKWTEKAAAGEEAKLLAQADAHWRKLGK